MKADYPTVAGVLRMAKKVQKTKIVAFKVEEDIAEFLGKLKNKSDFIRKAILAQFSMECPLCKGSGVVPQGVNDHYKPIIAEHNKRQCESCTEIVTIPFSLDSLSDHDRKRVEQFYHGGPLFCDKCYPAVPLCEDCEWHIPNEDIVDHIKRVHAQ